MLDYTPAPAAAPGGQAAEWIERVGAAVIDGLIRVAIALPFVLAWVLTAGDSETNLNIATLIGAAVALPYAPIMMSRTNGQTVGHRVVNTRVTWTDGRPATLGRAAVREVLCKALLFEGIAIFACYVPTLLNYLWPLWDDRNEALHDKLCNTRVVKA